MIGITERGDAGIDFSWVEKIPDLDFAILITKNINDQFINKAIKFKDKVIIHATITGMGGTVIEPYVPTLEWSVKQLEKLISLGFPAKQIVLRLDPIFPTQKGILTAQRVLASCAHLGINRCRISIVDGYSHVKKRFANANIPFPTFDLSNAYEMILKAFKVHMLGWEFEACAEGFPFQLGCISQKDVNILGLEKSVTLVGNKGQRKGCLCPQNKIELLTTKSQCSHRCLYCYWSSNF